MIKTPTRIGAPLGVPKSSDHRHKISESLLGVPKSSIHRRKISESLLGKPKSEETKEKIRAGIKAHYASLSTPSNE